MSHSLHRRGPAEQLKHDYILLATAASGINSEGSKDKLRKILDLVWEIGPINTGSNETGTILSGVSLEEIKQGFTAVPRVRCCFDSAEKVREMVRRLQQLDLGISIALSGPRRDIEEMCREFGLKPHSVNLSLDIWGKKEKLPPEEVLEFMTMCGHGLISKALIIDTVERVRQGKMTPQAGAIRMGAPCVCGLFNPTRAIRMLEKYQPAE